MGIITKTKTRGSWLQSTFARKGETANNVYVSGASTDTIAYEDGPKRSNGVNNWKQCHHDSVVAMSGLAYRATVDHRIWGNGLSFGSVAGYRPYTGSVPASVPPVRDLMDMFYDQVDLNCSDGVLLYSGILQAVPLVGGALKGVSLLNNAARKMAKSFRHKPFTTAVKSLIQADFIDRFVVSPTLDDMRKFNDASDYVLRVLNTARTRDAELATAFEQEITAVASSSDSTKYYDDQGVRWHLSARERTFAKAKLCIRAKVTYDHEAIDPIKLWAARIGLTRPLDSVWDLIPFSFVIDYFTRAGDFISHVGDQLSEQRRLKGRVARIHDAWLMTTRSSTREVTVTGAEIRVPSMVSNLTYESSPMTSGHVVFDRMRVPIMNESSFWDGGGLVKPNLSITRARTIAELIIQAKL